MENVPGMNQNILYLFIAKKNRGKTDKGLIYD